MHVNPKPLNPIDPFTGPLIDPSKGTLIDPASSGKVQGADIQQLSEVGVRLRGILTCG